MIDLKKQFGKRFKVFYDPSWDAESADHRTELRQSGQEPWYYELRGPNVIISPRTGDTVVAHWIGKGSAALSRACLSSKRLDGEMLYIIANSALESVLGPAQVYRKRQVTEAARERGKALAAKYGFGKR